MTIEPDMSKKISAALKKLSNSSVYIGVADEGADRKAVPGAKGAVPTNAQLAYIHETGSPARNIPARPFLRPGMRDSQNRWQPMLDQAVTAALKGDEAGIDKALHRAGIIAVAAVKQTIVAKIPPPIKPATMAARRRHRGGGKKKREARAEYREFYKQYRAGAATMDMSSVTPLVDTAQLLNSITYVIRK
jgi:hypothetical protein